MASLAAQARFLPRTRAMLRLAVLFALFGGCTALRAESPTAQFATAQLDVAQSEFDRAAGALRMQDYALARQLAAQAQLDARLAWGMTESPFVRRAALELVRSADRLRMQGVLSASVGIHAAP